MLLWLPTAVRYIHSQKIAWRCYFSFSSQKDAARSPLMIPIRDVEAESESGPFSVEAEARKSFHFRISYLTWRVTWRNIFVHLPMWIKRWSCTISLNERAMSVARENEKKHRGKSIPSNHFLYRAKLQHGEIFFAQIFPASVLGFWDALWEFTEQNTCNLKSYMDYFIRHSSRPRVPMRRDPWNGLRDQWTMLKTVRNCWSIAARFMCTIP